MPLIELQFPVLGTEIPADHGYTLYGAISRLVPKLHAHEMLLRIGPIRGSYVGSGKLRLEPGGSRLRVRLQPDQLPALLPLSGKCLDLAGHAVRLGVPQVSAIMPGPSLLARLVTIKGFTEPASFLDAARRQFDALGIRGELAVPLAPSGQHKGQARRRVMRLREKQIVGFALAVMELNEEDSLKLQEAGLGGRSKMGCGFFVLTKKG